MFAMSDCIIDMIIRGAKLYTTTSPMDARLSHINLRVGYLHVIYGI
jgi:hypothetical protein